MIEVDEIANDLNEVSVEIFSIRNNLYRLADSIHETNGFSAYVSANEARSRLSEAVMLIDDVIAIMVEELEAKLENDYDL